MFLFKIKIGKKLVNEIKPIYYENFYNLDRDDKFQMMMKKSLEIFEFIQRNNINPDMGFYKLGIIGYVHLTFFQILENL